MYLQKIKKMTYLTWDNKGDVEQFIRILHEGKVVVGSSDTVLGLYSDSTYKGFLSLNAIKARGDKPYLLLIDSKEKAELFVDSTYLLQMEKLMHGCWPGPLTIIFPAKPATASYLMGKDGTVALRVPAHKQLLYVLKHFNALFSTSANISGGAVPSTLAQLDPAIMDATEYIITAKDQIITPTVPSTIIQWTVDGFVVIREGAYSKQFLEQLCS